MSQFISNIRKSPSFVVIVIALGMCAILLTSLLRPSPEIRNFHPSAPEDKPWTNPVVVIGFSGVQWNHVDPQTTPHLAAFAQEAASANLVVRTLDTTTCPDAGWLMINTGLRTASPDGPGGSCAQMPAVIASNGGTRIANWQTFNDANASNAYKPQLGLLGRQLYEAKKKVAAVGSGAALAVADESGSIPGEYFSDLSNIGSIVKNHDMTVVDLGAARHPNWPLGQKEGALAGSEFKAAFMPAPKAPEDLINQVKGIDARLGEILSQLDPNTTVVLASVADSDQLTARMQYFAVRTAATKESDVGALANTGSTRQLGIVQLTDLLPTLEKLLNIPYGKGITGSPMWFSLDERSAQERITYLTDVEQRAVSARPAVGPFYIIFALFALSALVVAFVEYRRRRWNSLTVFALFFAAALPVSTFLLNLIPWWQLPYANFALLGCVFLVAMALAGVASRLTIFNHLAGALFIATLTMLVLSLDAALGSSLHFSSIMGDQPQSGGRFYGISNAPFVVFATSTLFALGVVLNLLRKKSAPIHLRYATIFLFAVFAVIIDGSPSIGADFGGPPALLMAFVAVLFLHAEQRLGFVHLFLIIVLGVGGMIGISYLDWNRPEEDWSHLGRFFDSIVTGNVLSVISRKFDWLITSVPLAVWLIVLPIVAMGIWIAVKKRSKILDLTREHTGAVPAPKVFPPDIVIALIGMVVLVFVGLVVNDSGLVLPMMGVLYGLPLWFGAAKINARQISDN
ncbi:DUF2339 domain-containing protein [Arcanobacterium ihumii]|uniref:hypothetical protein n=1 Tax=Arcanobacterium ihumii TaxID=2138162 RepID=UPI000F52EAF3|nr:hypothetical protein [Arcanobacterium ihumii]